MHLSCFALIALIVGVAQSYEFTEQERQLLANAHESMLNRPLRQAIERQRRMGVTSHWCCANGVPTKLVQRTRIKQTPVTIVDKVKVGYTNCGGLGMGRCSQYDARYRQAMEYSIENYDSPDEQMCRDQDVRCCDGYMLVAKNCVTNDAVRDPDWVTGLKDLKELGILGEL